MVTHESSYFVRVVHGLEAVVEQELHDTIGAESVRVSHRTIEFSSAIEPASLSTVRSVEDIFYRAAVATSITHTRDALAKLAEVAEAFDARHWADLKQLPSSRGPEIRFSVTASFIGKRNYNRWEIASAIADVIRRRHGWTYLDARNPLEESPHVHLRVHIEHERALMGVRVGERPLLKRAYKAAHSPGSLNPTVAYVMTSLAAKGGRRESLLDPACGVGTIPIEAALTGWERVCGSDTDSESIEKARSNSADVPILFEQRDLFDSSPGTGTFSALVSDLPWGSKTKLLGPSEVGALVSVLQRRSDAGTVWVLLVEDLYGEFEQALYTADSRTRTIIPISLFGRHPKIFVVEL